MNQNTISEFTGYITDVYQPAPPTVEERIDELASIFKTFAATISAKLEDITQAIKTNK